jgi:HSP20 family protein
MRAAARFLNTANGSLPMAEPNTTASDAAQSSTSSSAERGDGKGRSTSAEPRSFQGADPAAQKNLEAGQTAARDAIRSASQTGQALADTTRRTSRDAADVWRSSLNSFAAMQAEMRHMFDDLWRRTTGFGAPMLGGSAFAGGAPSFFGQPAADVHEGDDAYRLSIELPGLTQEDVDLTQRDDMIIVCGHKAEDNEQNGGAYRLSERRYGRFERAFRIPQDVDRERIEASFRDGLLKVTLPRIAEAQAQSRKIELKG